MINYESAAVPKLAEQRVITAKITEQKIPF
jgi:hypothetical protein